MDEEVHVTPIASPLPARLMSSPAVKFTPRAKVPSPVEAKPPTPVIKVRTPIEVKAPTPSVPSPSITFTPRLSPVAPIVATPPPPLSVRKPITPMITPTLRRRPPIEKQFIDLDSIASPPPIASPRGRVVGVEPVIEITPLEMKEIEKEAKVLVEDVPPTPLTKVVSPPRSPPLPKVISSPTKAIPPHDDSSSRSPTKPPVDDDDDEKDLTDEEKWLMTIARIKVLKRGWPDLHVPDETASDRASLSALTKYYNKLKARVFAEECSGGYKKWLIAMFVFLEVLCVKVFHIDMSGFTMNQIMALNSYQNLLLELAEKYGKSYKSYFPVEARLLFMVGMNGVIFFVLKLLFGDANSDSARQIATALGGNGENSGMAGIVGSVMNMLTGGAPPVSGGETLKNPPPRRQRRAET